MNLQIPDDFSFDETINAHGWRALLPFTWSEESRTLEYVYQHSSGRLSTISMSAPKGPLIVECDLDDDETRNVVRLILQMDTPMDAFYEYCRNHGNLAHIPALNQGRLLVGPTVFEDVVKVICTTNTTWAQTKSMVARIVESYGAPLSSAPHRKAFPTPQQIASDSLEGFSAKAKLGYRNASVYKIASDVASGSLDMEELRSPTLTTTVLYKKLLLLPGIGPYAASCLMIYLGRYDRVNVDSWARMLVGKELGRTVTDKEVHTFFEKYGEWKALVYHFYPWRED